MKTLLSAAAISLFATATFAAPMTWSLTYDDGTPLGALSIDFSTGNITGSASGQFGTYSRLAFAELDVLTYVENVRVFDFFNLIDPASGTTYLTDYGDGSSESFKLNEAAIKFGTIAGPLSAKGGRFAVIIHEILNYDQTYTSCSSFEEFHDPETGEYRQGACLATSSETYYNVGSTDTYTGYLTFAPQIAAVPLPAGGLMLAAGLLALGVARRRKS